MPQWISCRYGPVDSIRKARCKAAIDAEAAVTDQLDRHHVVLHAMEAPVNSSPNRRPSSSANYTSPRRVSDVRVLSSLGHIGTGVDDARAYIARLSEMSTTITSRLVELESCDMVSYYNNGMNMRKKEKQKISRRICKLKSFIAEMLDTFAALDVKVAQSQSDLGDLLSALRLRSGKLKKRLLSIKSRRNLWSVFFAAAVIGLLIGSLALAVVDAPPAAVAAPASAATIAKAIEPLFNSAWDEAEKAVECESEEILEAFELAETAARELKDVGLLVAASVVYFDTMRKDVAALALSGGAPAAMQTVAARSLEEAGGRIKALQEKVELCRRELDRVCQLGSLLPP